jgi:ABC-2 type transport system permease protein
LGSIYRLTLRQLTGKFRLLIMTALAALPVIMALVMLAQRSAPSVVEFETVVFSAMLAGSIIPLVVLAIAAAAFANEVEDSTLANLTLTPLARWQIVIPKLLAVITIAAPFAGASAFITSQVAFLADTHATIAVTLAALAGVALYASAFVWLGLVTTHAIALGLLYIVLWEGFFSGFVSGVRLLSIRHYSIALMHAMDERRFATAANPGDVVAIVTAVLVFSGFLFLSVRRLRRMDVP